MLMPSCVGNDCLTSVAEFVRRTPASAWDQLWVHYGSNKAGQDERREDDKRRDYKELVAVDYTEKAGVGGSIPSLATIIPKHLAHIRSRPPSRTQSAILRRDPVRSLTTMTMKHLTSNCLSLSPLSVRFCLQRG